MIQQKFTKSRARKISVVEKLISGDNSKAETGLGRAFELNMKTLQQGTT